MLAAGALISLVFMSGFVSGWWCCQRRRDKVDEHKRKIDLLRRLVNARVPEGN